MTGASGTIGRHLVPWLADRGARVIALGRRPEALASLRGASAVHPASDFGELVARGDVTAVLDLAVVNSDARATLEEFMAVNHERVLEQLALAGRHGTRRYLALSSYHAADPDNASAYAASKRALEEALQRDDGGIGRIVILPKVVTGDGRGAAALAWRGLAAVKPATFLPAVQEAIADALDPECPDVTPVWVESIGHNRLYAGVSRALDIVVALGIILALGWAMVLLAIAIRRDSPGPAIFRQRRVGRGEAPFTLLKFRTMAVGTREAGTHEVGAAQVTRIGQFLRRTKLDELPQAFNILRGELALVGPRPCLFVQTELVERRRKAGIFAMRPGLTGLAQVNGVDMSDPAELVRWELVYLRIRGLMLDLRILVQTFVGRGSGDKVAL